MRAAGLMRDLCKAIAVEESQCGHWIKRGNHATRWDCGTSARSAHAATSTWRGNGRVRGYIVKTHVLEVMHELLALKRTNKNGPLRNCVN